MSSIKFLLDFAKTGDLKSTLADFKALNSELQKNKSLQKDFGDSFNTATKSVSTNLDEIALKTKKAHDALKVTGDAKEIARLTKEIAMLRNEYDRLSASTSEMLVKNEKLKQQTLKTDQQSIKTQRESLKLQNDKIRSDEQAIKRAQKKAQEQAKLNSIYAQESARLNDLRKKYKDMALSEGTASKEARQLLRDITQLDGKLKGIDASVGQFQRNVGNYGSALKKFGSSVTTLLGIGGGAMLARDAFQSFSEFQQGLADLSALTGLDATGKEMEFLKQQSLELAKTSTASASEVLDAYKLIGSAQPELLKDVDGLNKMAESFIVLADASGLELPEAVKAGTDIMNQFGLSVNEVDRVINTLAAGAKEGSAEVPDLSAAMLEAGVSMKQANVQIEEGVAQIEALAARGIKGSEAGTKLRNVLTKLSAVKALPKEAVDQLEAAGVDMELLGSKTTSVNDKLKELEKISGNATALVKVFGLENQTAASILIDSRQKIQDLTEAVTGTDEAFKQAEARTGTVGQEFKKLKNTFEALVIEFIDGGGDFASTIKFIRENLSTILNVAFQVIKAFVIFKTTTMAVNATMKAGQIGSAAYASALSLFGKSADGANKSFKALDASMKANVIGLVVVAVYELADALGVFQSEAEALEERLDKVKNSYDSITQAEDAITDARIKSIKERASKALELATEEEKEFIKLKERGEIRKVYQTETNEITRELTERSSKIRNLEAEIQDKLTELENTPKAMRNASRRVELNAEITFREEVIAGHKLKIETLENREIKYNNLLADLNHEQAVDNKETNDEIAKEDSKATEEKNKEFQNRLKSEKEYLAQRLEKNADYQRKLKELEASNMLDEEAREIEQERLRNKFAQQDLETYFANEQKKIEALSPQSATETEKRRMIEENNVLLTQLVVENEESSQNKIKEIRDKFSKQRIEEDKKRLQDELNEELVILDDYLKEEEMLLINQGKTKEEIEMRLLERKAELLEAEIILRKEAGEKTIDQELELARLRKGILDKEAEARKNAIMAGLDGAKKVADKRKEELDQIREFTTETIDLSLERAEQEVENNINSIEREIDAQERNIETQRQLAEQGLENTLAFEKQVQAQNEARMLEEQRRLEKIKKIETYFNLLSAYAQEDPNSAPAKALAQIAVADAIAARLEDGGIIAEEVAKQNGGVLKGKSHKQGGILIEAEGDEGILSKKEMRNLGTNNFRTLKKALSNPVEGNFMRNQNEEMLAILPQQRMMVDFSRLESKLDKVEKAINNKPVPTFTIDRGGNMITKTETVKYVKTVIQKRSRI